MSGPDAMGLPKIDKLDFVISIRNYRLSPNDLEDLIERVGLIHDLNYEHLLENLKRNNG